MSAPMLDMDVMKRVARSLPKDEGMVAELRKKTLVSPRSKWDTSADKIAKAARPDCLTAFQNSGVLAVIAIPLAIVTDRKDSGCKF